VLLKPEFMKLILPLLILLSSQIAQSQTKPILNVDYMLRGHLYAKSSLKDTEAPGGFGGSDNAPRKFGKAHNFSRGQLSIVVDTTEIVTFTNQYSGYRLYIVNGLKSTVEFNAADSRLSAFAEAYVDGKWQPIEYLPSSWCGNSYHQLYLQSGEYWEFAVPRFDGDKLTKIRYNLKLADGNSIYSNSYSAMINDGQLTEKQSHTPIGIMDSYND